MYATVCPQPEPYRAIETLFDGLPKAPARGMVKVLVVAKLRILGETFGGLANVDCASNALSPGRQSAELGFRKHRGLDVRDECCERGKINPDSVPAKRQGSLIRCHKQRLGASRVAYAFLVYMLPPLPRRSGWAYYFARSPNRVSLPRKGRRVGLRIVLFEACSAFTRVTACTLAPSTSIAAAPVASGWSGCRVGLAPTGKRRLVTAHTHLGR
jgi:hypothetical protein